MEKFLVHRGVAAPLLQPNIDTDAIIPSREMKRVSKHGLGKGLFAGWRYTDAGARVNNPDFVLNQAAYQGASILLSGDNFGCGSSREHAVWALREYGIRAIIAQGFGAIFANNCIRNGLLPVSIKEREIQRIADWVSADPQSNAVEIDLPRQLIRAGGDNFGFEIDPGLKRMLVEGLDAIALTLTRKDTIDSFHIGRKATRPWLYS